MGPINENENPTNSGASNDVPVPAADEGRQQPLAPGSIIHGDQNNSAQSYSGGSYQASPPGPSSALGSRSPSGGGDHRRKRLIKTGLIAAVVVSLVAAGVVFGWYIPNKPENVWRTSLGRTGDTLENLMIAATEEDKLQELKNTEMTGSMDVTSKQYAGSITLSSRFDTQDTDTSIDLKLRPEGQPHQDIGVKMLTALADGKNVPDVYFRISGIKSLGLDFFLPGISELDNQWLFISSEFMESQLSGEDVSSVFPESFTHKDAAELTRAVMHTTNEYVFSADPDKGVLVMKAFVGTESMDDDITANHYTASVHKDNAKKYCKALVESIMATDAYQRLPDTKKEQADKEKEREESTRSCQSAIDEDIKDGDTFDLWVDKKFKMIHKVRITDKEKTGDYYEIGQAYKGGDNLPLFIVFHSDEQKSDGVFKLNLDIKQNITKGEFNFEKKGDNAIGARGQLEFKPHEGDVTFKKPEGALPFEEVMRRMEAQKSPNNPVLQ